MKLPTLYIPHGGGPCFFMDWTMGPADTWDRMAAWLRELDGTLPEKPRALLVVSAHWEAPVPTVMTSPAPPLLYDYSGFPPHTYELTWPAPGAPELASRVRHLLSGAGFESREDAKRGFDHGVFVPLKVAYPDARVPTVQLSLREGLDPAQHLAMGRALAPLRDEGVLIVGSGMSYHNMRGFSGGSGAREASVSFDTWLGEAVAQEPEERVRRLVAWAQAPAARQVHPREEHLLPLMVVAGAAGADRAQRAYSGTLVGLRFSGIHFA
jgi:aromatic ring-opening dioxygenase catalytic subunit (LigB family)